MWAQARSASRAPVFSTISWARGTVRRVGAGAAKLIQKLKATAAPGATIYIVEFGSPASYPRRVDLHGHVEHSIHFGHLKAVAASLGFGVRLETLTAWLNFDTSVKAVERRCLHDVLEHLLAFVGRDLPARAYTKKALDERLLPGERLANLTFFNVGSHRTFMDPGDFLVLQLSAPSMALLSFGSPSYERWPGSRPYGMALRKFVHQRPPAGLCG